MKKPKEVKVVLTTIPVIWQPNKAGIMDETYGLCDFDSNQICIRSDIAKQLTRSTLLHELVHYFLFCRGYTDHDEKLVDGLAMELLYFIQNNSDVLDWLSNVDK